MNNQSLLQIALIYLAVINVVTFFVYGIDKWKAASKRGQSQTRLSSAEREQARPKVKAKKSKWRIRETALLGLAVLGGSIGAWLGMKVWHHKTLHKKFRYGVPLILIAQIALLFFTSCRTKQQIETTTPVQHEAIQEHSPNVFLVMYDAEIGKEPLLKAVKEYRCEVIYDYTVINGMALRKPDGKPLEETMQYFKKVNGVTHVEYDHVYHLTDRKNPYCEVEIYEK